MEAAPGKGAVLPAPEIPHHVKSRFVPLCPCAGDNAVAIVEQGAAAVILSLVPHAGKAALGRERNAAVKQQVAVAAKIGAAVFEDIVHVAAKRQAFAESGDIFVYQCLLVARERIGVSGVEGGKVLSVQRIALAGKLDREVREIDFIQQQALVHFKAGVTGDKLPFKLEAENAQSVLVALRVSAAVAFLAKLRQRAQRYSVAALKHRHIAVVKADAQHRRYAGG